MKTKYFQKHKNKVYTNFFEINCILDIYNNKIALKNLKTKKKITF